MIKLSIITIIIIITISLHGRNLHPHPFQQMTVSLSYRQAEILGKKGKKRSVKSESERVVGVFRNGVGIGMMDDFHILQ